MPPRPDGAAVVISPESTDDGVPTAPEIEPNDTPATAQRLLVTPAAPAAVAATLQPRAEGAKRDVDFFLISAPVSDGGAAGAPVADAGGAPARPPLLVRADVRPAVGLTVTLEALDAGGHVLVSAAASQPGEAVAIPNLP